MLKTTKTVVNTTDESFLKCENNVKITFKNESNKNENT